MRKRGRFSIVGLLYLSVFASLEMVRTNQAIFESEKVYKMSLDPELAKLLTFLLALPVIVVTEVAERPEGDGVA